MIQNKYVRIVLDVLIILVIAAYGFIGTSVLSQIDENKENIDQLNPIFLQIQSDLSVIKTDLEWLKKKKQNLEKRGEDMKKFKLYTAVGIAFITFLAVLVINRIKDFLWKVVTGQPQLTTYCKNAN